MSLWRSPTRRALICCVCGAQSGIDSRCRGRSTCLRSGETASLVRSRLPSRPRSAPIRVEHRSIVKQGVARRQSTFGASIATAPSFPDDANDQIQLPQLADIRILVHCAYPGSVVVAVEPGFYRHPTADASESSKPRLPFPLHRSTQSASIHKECAAAVSVRARGLVTGEGSTHYVNPEPPQEIRPRFGCRQCQPRTVPHTNRPCQT